MAGLTASSASVSDLFLADLHMLANVTVAAGSAWACPELDVGTGCSASTSSLRCQIHQYLTITSVQTPFSLHLSSKNPALPFLSAPPSIRPSLPSPTKCSDPPWSWAGPFRKGLALLEQGFGETLGRWQLLPGMLALRHWGQHQGRAPAWVL